MAKKSLGAKKFEAPKCLVCGVVFKHHKFIGGQTIKNICNCNLNLLEEEGNRVREKQKRKLESRSNYMGIRII